MKNFTNQSLKHTGREFQDVADNKLVNIQQLLSEIRDTLYHDHSTQFGDKTLFEHWQNADSAITTLRTIINLSK